MMRTNPPGRGGGAREWKTGNETDLGCQGVKNNWKPSDDGACGDDLVYSSSKTFYKFFYHHVFRSMLRKGSGIRRDSSIACDEQQAAGLADKMIISKVY